MNLKNLGFDQWFQDQTDSAKWDDCQVARVITVNKDSYVIKDGKKDVPAEITGKFMFSADSPSDYPTVGDWVHAQYFDNDAFAVIHEILPRKSVLRRKTSGKKIEFQLIAANIDTALIVQSLDFNFNINRLERYLVMTNESGICPVVLLSKSDLLSHADIEEKISEIHAVMPDIQVMAFSNKTHSGLDQIGALLVPGTTFCLLGSSGVGKTTLLNNLTHDVSFDTRSVREKDGKGRHTTTRRQLIILESGAMVIDTPGMRELGNIGIESGLCSTFDEIAALSAQCRYTDCSHAQEKGCAILAALKQGKISQERYQNFMKMSKESAFYEMSYLEKRRKDKQFGKMCKSVMRNKIKK